MNIKNIFFILIFFLSFVQCSSHNSLRPAENASPFSSCYQVQKTHFASGKNRAVATDGPLSSAMAMQIMNEGGNAIDAAVAVSIGLSIESPFASGIGGGGLMLLSIKGKKIFYDYRERAPLNAHPKMYAHSTEENNSVMGPLSVATPGLLKGLWTIHQKHGKMAWSKIIEKVINLAEKGVPLNPETAARLVIDKKALLQDEEMKALFYDNNGNEYKTGTVIRYPRLATLLKKIQKHGASAIYEGEFPQAVIEKLGKKGILSVQDFKKYKVYHSQPYTVKYQNYEFFTAPAPSSGGIVLAQLFGQLKFLNTLSEYKEKLHYLSEMMKLSYWDRAAHMGDARFVSVPVKKITSHDYLKSQFNRIQANTVLKLDPPKEDGQNGVDTTHFNIVDDSGIVVSSTQTHNYYFGSKIMVQGVVLNDEMDDFALQPGVPNAWGLMGSYKNAIAPLKTPLTSMTPTIIEKDGNFFMSLGGRGGGQIISSVFQIAYDVISNGATPRKAMEACRIHHQAFPNEVVLEKGFVVDSNEYLKNKGHTLKILDPWVGKVSLISKENETLTGISDPRISGAALAD